MENALQLFGTLVLTVLGFVVPLLTIIVSIFPDGIKALTEKYRNEKKQSEENIVNETKKRDIEKGLDVNAIEQTLNSLRNKRKEAETKLGYLKPIKFLTKTSLPFLISFIGILVALFNIELSFRIILIISSLISLTAGFISLIQSIIVVFEVGEIVNGKKGSDDEKIIALLSTLVEKAGENPYIAGENIEIKLNQTPLKEGASMDFSVDKKHEISVGIHNKSDKMAKVIEVGFVFPKNIVIEKSSNFSVTTTEDKQIVRFEDDTIQAHNNNRQGNISLTFLESKRTEIDIFIKGENVKYRKQKLVLNIVK
ncbi:MAG: hypothetical protein WC375_02725 [Methanomassiliicoccales archaeon]|jgi:F0F1-type ATP synthase assembly protein I